MKLGNLINPFLLFPIALLFLVGMYSLGWSNLFPELNLNMYIFIVSLSSLFLVIGWTIKKLKVIEYSDIPQINLNKHNPVLVVFVMIILFIMDVKYSGTIPLLAGDIEQYESFGMPIVDPLILSLIVFYSIYWFHVFLTIRKKKFLLFIFFNILMCILMARRATLVYVFVSILFVYIQKIKYVKKSSLILIFFLVLGFSSFFGYLGNMKAGLEDDYTTTYMGASDKFYQSGVPNLHYITYLYVCSPIANFQLTLNAENNNYSFLNMIVGEFTPDFIANKITNFFNLTYNGGSMEKVMEVLNVGTYFSGPYMTYGWLGVLFSVFYMIMFALTILFAYKKKSQYQVTLNAFLCSIFLMALFSNVFRLSMVCFVFLMPIFLNYIDRIKFLPRKD